MEFIFRQVFVSEVLDDTLVHIQCRNCDLAIELIKVCNDLLNEGKERHVIDQALLLSDRLDWLEAPAGEDVRRL